jgi:hypothetical protein
LVAPPDSHPLSQSDKLINSHKQNDESLRELGRDNDTRQDDFNRVRPFSDLCHGTDNHSQDGDDCYSPINERRNSLHTGTGISGGCPYSLKSIYINAQNKNQKEEGE